jgi:hypothetical protein
MPIKFWGDSFTHQRYNIALTVRPALSATILQIAMTSESLLEHRREALALHDARAYGKSVRLHKVCSCMGLTALRV